MNTGIPLTVLGGFLGAGKTTALNGLLRAATERVAVLVNDFGAINVDAGLIEARGGDMVALTNGCVCCAVGPDLGSSLAALVALGPDRVVVEASGVADPWRIAQAARLVRGVVLDAVVVLADAVAFPALLGDRWLTDTLERQVARADLVALSKCDAATPAERAATRAALERIRPGVPIVEAVDALLPGLLAAAPGRGSRMLADTPGHGFQSWSWPDPPPLDPLALRRLLGDLPRSVLRAKGVVLLGPDAVPHLLQLVGARWTLEPWRPPESGPGLAPLGVVLIGTPELPPPADCAALFAGTILAPQLATQEA